MVSFLRIKVQLIIVNNFQMESSRAAELLKRLYIKKREHFLFFFFLICAAQVEQKNLLQKRRKRSTSKILPTDRKQILKYQNIRYDKN